MSLLITELCKNYKFLVQLCVTARHREILDHVLTLFKLKSDCDRDIIKSNQDLTDTLSSICADVRNGECFVKA